MSLLGGQTGLGRAFAAQMPLRLHAVLHPDLVHVCRFATFIALHISSIGLFKFFLKGCSNLPSPSPDFSSQTAHLADWMYRRPGSTLRAAKQALQVNTSISPAEVFRHLEILERQNDGPLVVQQRYFDACEAALGLMEALDEALLRPDVRLTGRLVQGHWNQSAEIRLRVHASAEEVRPVLEHLAFDPRRKR